MRSRISRRKLGYKITRNLLRRNRYPSGGRKDAYSLTRARTCSLSRSRAHRCSRETHALSLSRDILLANYTLCIHPIYAGFSIHTITRHTIQRRTVVGTTNVILTRRDNVKYTIRNIRPNPGETMTFRESITGLWSRSSRRLTSVAH